MPWRERDDEPRPMTSLRAIEMAIMVMQAIAPLVHLLIQLAGLNGKAIDVHADDVTAALFKLQKIMSDLRDEGIHHIE